MATPEEAERKHYNTRTSSNDADVILQVEFHYVHRNKDFDINLSNENIIFLNSCSRRTIGLSTVWLIYSPFRVFSIVSLDLLMLARLCHMPLEVSALDNSTDQII